MLASARRGWDAKSGAWSRSFSPLILAQAGTQVFFFAGGVLYQKSLGSRSRGNARKRMSRINRVDTRPSLGRLAGAMIAALAAASGAQASAVCVAAPPPSGATLEAAIATPPAQAPQARAVLHTEGTLPHHGIRDESIAAKRDFGYMRDLALAWRLNHDRVALDRLAAYLGAWTGAYRPSFNPIDETGFDDVIDAYVLSAPDLPEAVRARTRQFLADMADGYLEQMAQHRSDAHGTWTNNWQSHRVKLATMAAAAIGDRARLAQARAAFVRQLDANLLPDGEVIDFRERDALHYVVYDLEPLTRAVLAAGRAGEDWTRLKGASGQTLGMALDWLEPFAAGRRTHEEYVHTSVLFDVQRREAGELGFSGLWKAKTAAALYWAASALEPRYLETARTLSPSPPPWLWASAPPCA